MSCYFRKFSGLILAVLFFGSILPAFAEAESLYRANCINCHAGDGSGKTAYATRVPVPDLHSKAVQDRTDNELYESVARGNRHKNYPHAYELRGMSSSDIRSLVVYIRAMKK